MHRASAADNPTAPLSHHTFDSTHIAYGVITGAIDRGPWVVEASVFNGREPDEHRWNFDFAPLDSVSGRVWYRPTARWELQASTGHLTHPEELEPGNIQRTTASAAWFSADGPDFTAITLGYGVNAADATRRHAVFAEATRHVGPTSLFTRVEVLQVPTTELLNDAVPAPGDAARSDTVAAIVAGAVRDVATWRGVETGIGAALTFYRVPDPLKSAYGDRPVSFQAYVRIRPPAGPTGRMWNMRMTEPMRRGAQ